MKISKLIKAKDVNVMAFFNILGPVILNGISFYNTDFHRALGPANYGVSSLYVTWVQVFTIIIGLQTSGTISTSMVHIDKKEHDAYRSSVLTLSACSMAVVTALVALFAEPIKAATDFSTVIIALVLMQSFGAFAINFASCVFIYQKEAYKNFIISVSTAVITVVVSLVLIFKFYPAETNYMGRIIGLAAPNIIIGLVMFAVFMAKGKTGFNKKYWKYCIPLCLPLVFHGLSQVVLGQTDKVMLKAFADNNTVGIYSLAVTVAHLLAIVWGALNNTWVPVYYDDLKKEDYGSIEKRTKNYMFLFTIITMGFLLVSPEVVKIFASRDYWSCIEFLPLLAVGSYMMFLYSFPVNYQFFHKKSVNIATGTVLAAVVNIVLNLVLIPKLGMKGAATATCIAYVALFVFHEIIAKFVIKGKYPFGIKMYYKSVIGVLLTVGAFYLLADLWYLRWIIASALGAALIIRIVKNKSIF